MNKVYVICEVIVIRIPIISCSKSSIVQSSLMLLVQEIANSMNRGSIHACSPYSDHIFSYASGNRVINIDIEDYKRTSITIPDYTASITSLAYTGVKNKGYFLFAATDKKKLYQYQKEELLKEIELEFEPESITSTVDTLFILHQGSLCTYSFFETDQIDIEVKNLNYTRCAASPNGRSIAFYNYGSFNVSFIFKSDLSDLKTIHFSAKFKAMQWCMMDYMSVLISTDDNMIRLYSAESDEFQCIATYCSTVPILSMCHCVDKQDVCDRFNEYAPARVDCGKIKPQIYRPKIHCVVITQTQFIFLTETPNGHFLSSTINRRGFYDVSYSYCTMRHIFSEKNAKPRYDLLEFSPTGLFFNQIEIGSNPDTKSVTIQPFCIQFIKSPIEKMFIDSNINLVSVSEGEFYNWSEAKEVKIPEIGYITKKELIKIEDNKIISEQSSFDLDYEPKFFDFHESSLELTIIVGDESHLNVLTFKNDFVSYEVDLKGVSQMKSVSIHSSDFFIICSTASIKAFIMNNMIFEQFADVQLDVPKAVFMQHNIPLLVAASGDKLFYYGFTHNTFNLVKVIETVPINCLVNDKNTLVASTNSSLYRFQLDPKDIPQQYKYGDEFVFWTALSMSKLAVIDKMTNKIEPCLDDFSIKEYDSFVFPMRSPPHLPQAFKTFCDQDFGWNSLDYFARRFLFSYTISRECSILTSIWCLLSKTQRQLVNFESVEDACNSFVPLWAENVDILNLIIQKLASQVKADTEDFESLLLFYVASGRRSVAQKLAQMTEHKKLEDALAEEDTPEIRKKFEASAFKAQQIHKYSLASMFFILAGKQTLALNVLKNNQMLQIFVARLIGDESWKEDIDHKFYYYWINKQPEKAMEQLYNMELQENLPFSLELHRLELIEAIQNSFPLNYMLNISKIPFFKHESKEEIIEMERRPSFIKFSFGKFDIDITDDEDNEEPTPMIEEDSDFFETFFTEPYQNVPPVLINNSELELVSLLSKLFTMSFTHDDVHLLIEMALSVENQTIQSTILFSLAFAFSKTNFILPLVTLSNDIPLRTYIKEFEDQVVEILNRPPDILSSFACIQTHISDYDIKLANCLTFNKMAITYAEILSQDENLKILPAFLHHYHRLFFDSLEIFAFSKNGFIDDLDPLQLDVIKTLNQMEASKLDEKWIHLLNDGHHTPFFDNQMFTYTSTTCIKTSLMSSCHGVSIHHGNNNLISYVGNRVSVSKICENELALKSSESYDSPFATLLGRRSTDCFKEKIPFFVDTWERSSALKAFTGAVAVDSHPSEDFFVTGGRDGDLYIWNFNTSSISAKSTMKYYNSRINKVEFNERGNKILASDYDGRVYTSDFSTNHMICQKKYANATWLNYESQIVVTQPEEQTLNIYDSRASDLSVASFRLLEDDVCRLPISAHEYQIVVGHSDGRVSLYDIRTEKPEIEVPHKSRLTTIKFDKSGNFFLTGSQDNNIKVFDPKTFTIIDSLKHVFSDYDIKTKKKGILDIAISKQAIVACGYSSTIRVWASEGPKRTAITESRSYAVDLRMLPFV